ncbi:MAG: type VI secretion system lipoprotein TssJ [Halopseudomonas sp.]
MMRLFALMLMPWLLLPGCSSSETTPRHSEVLSIGVSVGADVNPDGKGEPHPVVLRIYQLSETGIFEGTQFIDLYKKDRQMLGGSMVDVVNLEPLQPGISQQVDIDLQYQTRYLAVLAEFAEYSNANTKALIKLSEDPLAQSMSIHVSGQQVSISQQEIKSWWQIY